jgi:hypothetical protein
MGRGLSDLQREILKQAYRSRVARQDFEHVARRNEWGWNGRDGGPIDLITLDVVRAINPTENNRRSVQAGVSRAITRLVRRGLVCRVARTRSGFRLTDTGAEIAKQAIG